MRVEKRREAVDVIIPVYKPDRKFGRLLKMLAEQTYPVNRIIVMNTERAYWNDEAYRGTPGLEVHHLSKEEFDHGGTRNLGAWYSEAPVMVFMTDDAVPQDRYLIERLVEALEQTGPSGEVVAEAYARQVPAKDCRTVERYVRAFNYPEESRIKTKADLPQLGIKTYFASNVCCAYKKEIFNRLEGFVNHTLFNEDMLYAAEAVKAGYAVAYAAEAKVIHSHNLTPLKQLHRNFDMAVSQADHPEIFDGVPSEGEGIRMIKTVAARLLKTGRFWLLPELVLSSAGKYLGYRLGKNYRRLPKKAVLWCSTNDSYWEKTWRKMK
ncbi:MAG: glycosyltransferase [Eubacteriales bacterium]|nr:glycosyltransferase [Eubacteriales bacterium]